MSVVLRMIVLLAVLLIGLPVQAAEQWKLVPEKSQIAFIGRATLHGFHGKAKVFSGGFEQDQASAKGSVSVEVAGLNTENPERDKHMYLMFEEPKYPKISFNFDQMDMGQVAGGKDGNITITGVMTMHNVSQPVTLVAKARWSDGVLICEGKLDVSLKVYDLRPPVMLMVMRVGDRVTVEYTIAFAK